MTTETTSFYLSKIKASKKYDSELITLKGKSNMNENCMFTFKHRIIFTDRNDPPFWD